MQTMRNHVVKNHDLSGGETCQDPCTFGATLNGAADTIVASLVAMYLLWI